MAKLIELALAVLQFQTEGLLTIADIFLASPERIRREFYRIPTYERRWFSTDWVEVYRNRQQFHRTLQYMKRQGLVTKRGARHGMQWTLTRHGIEKLAMYRKRRADLFSGAHVSFPAPHGGGLTIVAFDIPEKERRKRDWIRRCLVEMDFKPLQKSVWTARGGVHEDFVEALRERNLLNAVHIFGVTKHGTIKENT